MLTTGGGWQDQVGGLFPAIKVGHSKAEIPVKIDVKFLQVSENVIQSFGDQLILVYTGKTRLARNLLQVRHLHRVPKIGTPLFSFYNFSQYWPILMKIISLCSLLIFLASCNIFTDHLKYSLQIN